MLKYLLLVVGFILLIKGADFFVDGSSSVARILKIPSIIIGLTIVSIGTSLPEASVSITAGLSGNSDIAIGNVIGSNFFNLLAVIGVSAIFLPIPSPKEMLNRDLLWNIAVTFLLLVFMYGGSISRVEGLILLTGLIIYLVVLVRSALKNRVPDESTQKISVIKSTLFIILGLAAIILGGNLVVDNACLIAKAWGMSETLVGLTIVAIGTSLPELVTSMVAAGKGDSGIAIGNAIGSSIFNILFILGSAAVLTPVNVAGELMVDCALLVAVGILMYIITRTGKKIGRFEGICCVLVYVAYAVYIIIR
ncbi:MAG: calcium/sodium antiporter [Lachnospiraceae bacterium]